MTEATNTNSRPGIDEVCPTHGVPLGYEIVSGSGFHARCYRCTGGTQGAEGKPDSPKYLYTQTRG